MTITHDLLTRALCSFPEKPEDALQEDSEWQQQFCAAMESNVEYTHFAAYMRERLMENLTAKRFIQITTLFAQLGYRLHSMEMMEGLNPDTPTDGIYGLKYSDNPVGEHILQHAIQHLKKADYTYISGYETTTGKPIESISDLGDWFAVLLLDGILNDNIPEIVIQHILSR